MSNIASYLRPCTKYRGFRLIDYDIKLICDISKNKVNFRNLNRKMFFYFCQQNV